MAKLSSMDISEAEVSRNFLKFQLGLNGEWRELPGHFFITLGYSEDGLKKLSFTELIHPENNEVHSESLENLKEGKLNVFEGRVQLLKKSGDPVNFLASYVLIRDEKGKPDHILCHLVNLSKQHEVQHKLEEREQQLESLFKHNPHPVYYFDLDGNFQDVNEKLVEFTGYSRQELLNMSYVDFIVEADLELTRKNFKKASNGQAGQYDIRVRVKGGEEREIKVTKFPKFAGDEVTGVYGILQDVTDEKISKRSLEKSEQRFKSLFERNPNAVFSFDTEGNFILANKALEELTGYKIEELKKLDFKPLTSLEDRYRVTEKLEKALEGQPQTYETKGIHKNGHTYYVQVTNLPIVVDGKIEGNFGIAHDITERKKAQKKIEESEKRWQKLVKQNPQPVQIVQDGVIVFLNQAGADYYGASSPEEVIGKPILDFPHPDYLEKVKQRKVQLEGNNQVEPTELKIVDLNGKERIVEAYSIPVNYKGRDAIQTVIHDITELKEKQKTIGRSLKEKEMLLQEIHHRVKNNLAMISSMLELQIMQSNEQAAINALRDSQLRIQSIAIIHEKLYQSESLHKIGFDKYLGELVETIKKMYSDVDGNVETVYDLDHVTLGIEQAIPCSLLVNEVIVNSFKHAFPNYKEGTLRLKLDYDEPDLKLEIEDDGVGLPDDFDIQQQDSLGMTLIQALANQLEGEISLSSNSGKEGTKFELSFKKNHDR